MYLVRAYAALSTCRAGGMAVMPVPVTAIWEWCDRNGVTGDAARFAARVLRAIDAEIIRRANERAEAQRPARKATR